MSCVAFQRGVHFPQIAPVAHLSRQEAALDRKNGSGDVATSIADEKEEGGGQLLRIARPSYQNSRRLT